MKKKRTQLLLLLSTALSFSLFSGCSGNTPTPSDASITPENQRLEINTRLSEEDTADSNQVYTHVSLNNTDETKSIIKLSNEGGKTLKLFKIKSKSSTPKLFKLTNNCSKLLSPTANCKLEVEFLGKKEGEFEQTITVTSNDIVHPSSIIKVKVEAVDKLTATIIQSNKHKSINPMMELYFNKIDTIKYVEIQNTGHETLDFKGLKIKGLNKNAFRTTNTCPKNLKVDAKCKVTIHYNSKIKKGESNAKLKILINGDITPSKNILLSAYSEPYTLKLKSYIVSKNIKEYMDDYFHPNNFYFLRTIYQNEINSTFKKLLENNLHTHLKDNKMKKTSSPTKATKIINLYPNIELIEDTPGNIIINIGIHGYYASKASYSGLKLIKDGNTVLNQSSDLVSFTSINSIKKFYDKEPFSFFIKIEVTGYEDKNDVYNRVSEIISQKLINVLGIRSY